MENFTVVGLGAIVVDEQMFLDRVPGEDEKERATVLRQQIGGPVPTALVQLSRFGERCFFIGPWGDDVHGAAITADLAREGVRASKNCCMPGRRSGVAHVWTSRSTGARTIASMLCGWDGFALTEKDRSILRSCRVLHLDGTGGQIAVQAATDVRDSGGVVTVDAGSPKEATEKLIPLADIFSFPERFSQQFFGSDDFVHAGKRLLSLGAKAVICTRGKDGAVLFTRDDIITVPGIPVQTVDSTGAGDVFCGGLIATMLKQATLETAVRTGGAAAALKCQHIGNRDALPNWSTVERLLADLA